MPEALIYRLMNPTDAIAVSELASRVFNEFIAPEFSLEGVHEFQRYIQPNALLARSHANHFTVIGVVQDQVVGMIEVRDYSHISLLFVAPEYHRQGIAKTLWHKALQICLTNEPELLEVSVNSSPYAALIYEKLGFRRIGDKQVRNGITFIPMVMNLLER